MNFRIILAICVLAIASCGTSGSTGITGRNKPPNYRSVNTLDGKWMLNYVMSPGKKTEELYPDTKPFIEFDTSAMTASGSTGCNSFSGSYITEGRTLTFSKDMAVTEKFCSNGMEGEKLFLETLGKVNTYAISDGKVLNLIIGDIAVMRLERVEK